LAAEGLETGRHLQGFISFGRVSATQTSLSKESEFGQECFINKDELDKGDAQELRENLANSYVEKLSALGQ
jgi:hypothetical protein